MSAQLHRRLGLYAVFTVSVGAMIGSGIFVLPGLGFEVGGPSVILAYVIAGLIVLPAALAKSEMATAIPRAGGTYLYIDMAMGPLMGTIAGFGVWLSLVFKAAFALDGLGLYLGLFADIDVVTLSLGIGAVLLAINLIGIRESGMVQATLVSVVLAVLFVFIGGGATFVDSALYHPFLPTGVDGLLSTAALVFVSYAGVTKVVSLAEEVANPARTLPVAIISSLLIMMFAYPAVTYVMVGVTPPEALAGDLTPLATASNEIFPAWMASLVAIVGVLALASMANAGLLAASRYPFAMARRRLAPSILSLVGQRSGIPTVSILLTGSLLLGLVASLPVFELAKLASAFQLLVFAMVNIAYVAFRSSRLWWYRPKFHAPGYPLVPILGAVACLLLITQLGLDAILGAAGIIVGGLIWYQIYGRSRALKENAFRESVRQQGMTRLLQRTGEALDDDSRRVVVVSDGKAQDTWMLRIGRAVAGSASGSGMIPIIPSAKASTSEVDEYDPQLVIGTLPADHGSHGDDLPDDRDVALVAGVPPGSIETIAVLGSGGPFDVLKISIAAKLAEAENASLRFVHVLDPGASRAQVRSLESFHAELDELCDVPTESMVIESEDLIAALTSAVGDADLAIIGSSRGHHLFTDLIDRIVDRVSIPVLLVRVADDDGPTSIRSLFDRIVTNSVARGDVRRET
jgi:amino acid transporter/nucleotide-binding universal stress UspA family protein